MGELIELDSSYLDELVKIEQSAFFLAENENAVNSFKGNPWNYSMLANEMKLGRLIYGWLEQGVLVGYICWENWQPDPEPSPDLAGEG